MTTSYHHPSDVLRFVHEAEQPCALICVTEIRGGAMRANPLPIFVPCHRVISAGGKVGGFSGGVGDSLALKRRLLGREGIDLPEN